MRSRCRSLLLSMSLLSACSAWQLGAAPRFSFFQLEPAQAKGGEAAAAQDGDSGESGPKCSTGGPGGPGPGPGAGPGRPRRFSGGFSPEAGLGPMHLDFSALNLSDEQKTKIKAIRGRNAARAKDLRQSLQSKGNEFRDLLFSETASSDQVTAKRDEMKPLKEELDNLRLSDFLAIRAVFTPEQRKKWAESKPPETKFRPRGGGAPGGSGDGDGDKADKSDKSDKPSTTVKTK